MQRSGWPVFVVAGGLIGDLMVAALALQMRVLLSFCVAACLLSLIQRKSAKLRLSALSASTWLVTVVFAFANSGDEDFGQVIGLRRVYHFLESPVRCSMLQKDVRDPFDSSRVLEIVLGKSAVTVRSVGPDGVPGPANRWVSLDDYDSCQSFGRRSVIWAQLDSLAGLICQEGDFSGDVLEQVVVPSGMGCDGENLPDTHELQRPRQGRID